MTALVKAGVAAKGAFGKKEHKNITKEIKLRLKVIAKEKNLKKEDIIFVKKLNKKYILNSQAKEKLLRENLIKNPKKGKCLFLDSNYAYVVRSSKTKHYLYCSRNSITGEVFYLDIIDIFHILSDMSYGETETEIFKIFGIHTKEEEIKQSFRQIYLTNIEKVKNIDAWRHKYPNLYNRIKNTLETYKILNYIGLENVTGISECTDNMPVFFAAAGYISKLNGKVKKPTIRNHIKMLTLLGLIVRVDDEKIPAHMYNRAELVANMRKHPTIINFFSIPKITPELLRKADGIALIAKNNGLSLHNIGYKKIEEVFGEEILEVVYGSKSRAKEVKRAMDFKNYGESDIRWEEIKNISRKSESTKAIEQFLCKKIKGIGKATAKRIVEKFGENAISVISASPERLLEIKGIGVRRAQVIKEVKNELADYRKVRHKLMHVGLSALEIIKIYEKYGGKAVSLIKENPYKISKEKLISFRKADIIAKKLGISPKDKSRIKEAIIQYINYESNSKGNLFVYKDVLYSELNEYLKKYGAYKAEYTISIEEANKAIENLKEEGTIVAEQDENNDICLYLKQYQDIENNTVELIKKMLNEYQLSTISSIKIKDYLDKSNVQASSSQKQAIIMAMTNKISILTGGPGTGKTTTVKWVIDTIKNFYPEAEIELAAPTGKAARKLSEKTGMEAKTIHRLVGMNNLGEKTGTLKNISADFLIIDESGMIDVCLFYSLISVISDKTQILLIGDYNQLPSVGPGTIFKDLVESKIIPCVTLEKVFRQKNSSQILQNANKIAAGKKDLNLNNSDEFSFIGTKNIKKIKENIVKSIKKLLQIGYKMKDIQVITPMNIGDIGTRELNNFIQDKLNPRKTYKPEIKVKDKVFRVGDKVMQIINNYEINVFNGESGKIVAIDNRYPHKVVVDFGDRAVIYAGDLISQLTLSYAITAHKAQGDEFGIVIMPIHSSHSIMLNRNLIYTSWTRAKGKLVLMGDIEELYRSIDKSCVETRKSLLKDKLLKMNKELTDIPF